MLETRQHTEHVTSRKRECSVCGYRFFTSEVDEAVFAQYSITLQSIFEAAQAAAGYKQITAKAPGRYTKI